MRMHFTHRARLNLKQYRALTNVGTWYQRWYAVAGRWHPGKVKLKGAYVHACVGVGAARGVKAKAFERTLALLAPPRNPKRST